jgi:hypothetical protein
MRQAGPGASLARSQRRGSLVICLWALAGCRSPNQTPPSRATAPTDPNSNFEGRAPAGLAEMPTEPRTIAAFEERGIGVRIEAPRWSDACATRSKVCTGTLGLVVQNHSASAQVSIDGVELVGVSPSPFSSVTPFDAPSETLPQGRSVRRELPGVRDTEQRVAVVLLIRFSGGALVRLKSPPFLLANEGRESAKKACEAARGRWLATAAGAPLCARRARDGGKTCRDGAECEWLCLFDRYEPAGDPTARPRLGRPVGHCSEFVGEPGCASYVERDASRQPPSDIHAPPPRRCSD